MRNLDSRTIVNHFAVNIDESGSMGSHAREVVLVVDNWIEHLAKQSKDMDQETRVSVYAFSSRGTERCVIWDTDVLRVPSIEGKYRPDGLTALIDCTCLSMDDLKKIPAMYGEHSFVVASITDGKENNSRLQPQHLQARISDAPSEWTVLAFVPDQDCARYAERFGFHPGNISIWDTSGSFEQVGATLREMSDLVMEGRTKGVRGYKSGLFRMATVSVSDVERSLVPLTKGSYTIETNTTQQGISIRDFVTMTAKRDYHAGVAFYEFGEKSVKVQAKKDVFVQTGGPAGPVYGGTAARGLLGLPDYEVPVQKASFPDYSIFVQSTSYNRSILPGQRVLVLR